MKHIPDIDIDFKNRNDALELIKYRAASRMEHGEMKPHNVGIYLQDIPIDPISGISSIPYKDAGELGYLKVDFLNLNVYQDVESNEHMERLLAMEPEWDRLLDGDYTETLFHLSGTVRGQKSADIVANYQPKSVEDLAVVLALLRPRKNHLIGCSWDKIKSEIWEPGDESLYGFKKSHALSYSMVVVVQMNLRTEKELKDSFELVVLPSSSTANIV